MQSLTPAGERLVEQVAQRYGLSRDAVVHMLVAVNNGGGTMAQFNCPELGGGGQWMRGGMTMVGDMFNHGLKATVDNLCNELANALAREQIFPPVTMGSSGGGSHGWWPAELGRPFSTGSQNNVRYAVFPGRLAVEANGRLTVYDTLDHHIGGVSQQQGGDSSLTFSSQYGTIPVSSLRVVHGGGAPSPPPVNFVQAPAVPEPARPAEPAPVLSPGTGSARGGAAPHTAGGTDTIALIEQLARLHAAGVLTDDEFHSKKRELLDRL